jgi:hypothetical protein
VSETPADEIRPEPPIGEPIPIERPTGDDRTDSDDAGSGEHVVITPFTAGSAGAAHKEN